MRIDRSKFNTVLTPERSEGMMKVINTSITPRGHFSVLTVQTRLFQSEEGGSVEKIDTWCETLTPRPVDPNNLPDVRPGDAIVVDKVRHRDSGLKKTVALWGVPRTIGKFDRESQSVGLYALVGAGSDEQEG